MTLKNCSPWGWREEGLEKNVAIPSVARSAVQHPRRSVCTEVYQWGQDPWLWYEGMGDQTSQSWRKLTLSIHWKDWCWSSNTLDTWCKEPPLWKRPWCWERWKAKEKRDNRGWDGWMASLTQWTWVWANSRRQRIGKPGMLQSMGSQRVGQTTEWLNWTDTYKSFPNYIFTPPIPAALHFRDHLNDEF